MPCYYTSKCLITSAVFLFLKSDVCILKDTNIWFSMKSRGTCWRHHLLSRGPGKLRLKHLELNLFNWRCYFHRKTFVILHTNLLLTIYYIGLLKKGKTSNKHFLSNRITKPKNLLLIAWYSTNHEKEKYVN